MRILYATPHDPDDVGGIQTIVRNQVDGLRELGHRVKLVSIKPSDDRPLRDYVPKLRHIRLHDGVPGLHEIRFAHFNQFRRVVDDTIEEFDPEVIHAGEIRALPALRAASAVDIPSVLSTYALELRNQALAAAAINEASVVTGCSQYTKGLVNRIAIDGETRCVYPSIDIDAYRELDAESTGDVMTMCRFVDRKNVRTVIEAWRELDSDVRAGRTLRVVGDGPNREALERQASDMDDITFPGVLRGAEKRQALAESDLFAFVPVQNAFDVEGFGIVWIEAQAAGTPVIGSPYGGAPEAIGPNPVVQRPTDPQCVAEAMVKQLSGGTDKAVLKERAQQFSIQAIAKDLAALYQSLMEDRKSPLRKTERGEE
jgi:phosphatidylinositol alpha-1,6-mannosyltransferase